jgi:hypothetical protein
MSTSYVINNIYDFINRFYNLKSIVTKINDKRYRFDLGNVGAFVLNTDAFRTEADINAFRLGLAARLNNVLLSA